MQRVAAPRPLPKYRATPDTDLAERRQHAPMPVFPDHRTVPGKWQGGVYAIGNFDGLHIGHRALIRQTLEIAATTGAHPAVLTFDPHPRELFDPSALPFRLADAAWKTQELGRLGTGLCLNQRFDRDFAALAPDAFVDHVLRHSLRASHLVVGADFRFGSRQSGDTTLLAELCAQRGIGITVIDPVRIGGEVASSSLARRLIADGRMADVAAVLGRPWSVTARPERRADRLRFDLSDHTGVAAGAYDVRIGGETYRATLARDGDRRQVLSIPQAGELPAGSAAFIEFVG